MDYERFRIQDYTRWSVYLHANQYFLGRTYAWAKREDVVDLMDATEDEQKELFIVGRAIKNALAQLFQPDLMNYAALANEARHLHIHFIPRYASPRTFDGIQFIDERWGKNYAPYNYDFKTPEITLMKIRDLIREKLITNPSLNLPE